MKALNFKGRFVPRAFLGHAEQTEQNSVTGNKHRTLYSFCLLIDFVNMP